MSNNSIGNILKLHPSLEFINDDEKVKCRLSGHEMPARLELINAYTEGKRYQRLRKDDAYDYEKHQGHIVPSFKKGHEHQLFCRVTFRHLSKLPRDVERHVNGRRYKRALEKYEECQRLGVPFKPNKHKKRSDTESREELRQREAWMEDDGRISSDGEESVDSLSDLYPAEYFGTVKEEELEAEEEMDLDDGMVSVETNKLSQNGTKMNNAIKRKVEPMSIDNSIHGKKSKKERTIGKKLNHGSHGKMKPKKR